MKSSLVKKSAVIILTASTVLFAGCGGNDSQTVETSSYAINVSGEIIDAGEVSALCPDGWSRLEEDSGASDESSVSSSAESASEETSASLSSVASSSSAETSSSEEASQSSNELTFIKGGSTEDDLLTNAYINIACYGSDQTIMQIEPTEWYDNVSNLEDFTTGSYTWSGYSAQSLGVPFVYVTTKSGAYTLEVYLYTQEGTENAAAITDTDVLAILQSISF